MSRAYFNCNNTMKKLSETPVGKSSSEDDLQKALQPLQDKIKQEESKDFDSLHCLHLDWRNYSPMTRKYLSQWLINNNYRVYLGVNNHKHIFWNKPCHFKISNSSTKKRKTL